MILGKERKGLTESLTLDFSIDNSVIEVSSPSEREKGISFVYVVNPLWEKSPYKFRERMDCR